jgi:hypothetical protein
MREDSSMDRILEGFAPNDSEHERVSDGVPVTVWIPRAYKADYDDLQEMSKGTGRRFSAVARDGMIELIKAAKARVGSKAS